MISAGSGSPRGFTSEVAYPISTRGPRGGFALWDVFVPRVAEPCHQASAQQLTAKVDSPGDVCVEWGVGWERNNQ
jgi:hypothetical protein